MTVRGLLVLLLLCFARLAAAQVVDDRGVAIALPHPPQRIVTLLPSLTETVCAPSVVFVLNVSHDVRTPSIWTCIDVSIRRSFCAL